MFSKTKFPILVLLTVVQLIFQAGCKKTNPTMPEVENLTKPVIWVNTFELTFAASTAGANPTPQVLKIKNSGQNTINYTLSEDADWLTIKSDSGSSTGQIIDHIVTVDKTGLAAKASAYTAAITVTCPEAYNNPQKINVSLNVSKEPPPKISITPQALNFNARIADVQGHQKLYITNSGGGTLKFSSTTNAKWISLTPAQGSVSKDQKSIKVAIDSSGLAAGTHRGEIRFIDSAAANSPQKVKVTLTVSDTPPPVIGLSSSVFTFQKMNNGPDPDSQFLFVKNSGDGALNYSLQYDISWLSVSPTSGKSSGADKKHTLSVNAGGMGTGTYNGIIRVVDTNASNNPQRVQVTLNITAPLTDNKVGMSLNPSSASPGNIVTISIAVRGNTSEIKVFGLELHFDPTMFSYNSTAKGDLTSTWAAVGGNEISSGTIKIGGFLGSGNPIVIGSSGTIAEIKLQVTGDSHSNGTTSQITINSFSDDISGMIPSPASGTFTLNK